MRRIGKARFLPAAAGMSIPFSPEAPGLRRTARYLRHAPDRLLHPVRRRLALRSLEELAPVPSVLFVCLGNICRSPFAAGVLGQLAEPDWIGSAALAGSGAPSPSAAIATARRYRVDLSSHRSVRISRHCVERAALVVVMEPAQAEAVRVLAGARSVVLVLGDLDPDPIERRAIHDPFDQSRETFEQSYARIERCVRVLAGFMARKNH